MLLITKSGITLEQLEEISGDSIWLLVCRFIMACCWTSIYQELNKTEVWNVSVWNIIMQGHESFVTVSDLSNFVFINRQN